MQRIIQYIDIHIERKIHTYIYVFLYLFIYRCLCIKDFCLTLAPVCSREPGLVTHSPSTLYIAVVTRSLSVINGHQTLATLEPASDKFFFSFSFSLFPHSVSALLYLLFLRPTRRRHSLRAATGRGHCSTRYIMYIVFVCPCAHAPRTRVPIGTTIGGPVFFFGNPLLNIVTKDNTNIIGYPVQFVLILLRTVCWQINYNNG